MEIVLHYYKAICIAFLLELNYDVFLNWGLFLLLLNPRGCAFFVCIMNKSLIWKLLQSHAPFKVDLKIQFLLSPPKWTKRWRKASTCLTLVIELPHNTLSQENPEQQQQQQQLNYVLVFLRVGSPQTENEETKLYNMMDTEVRKPRKKTLGLELGHLTKD